MGIYYRKMSLPDSFELSYVSFLKLNVLLSEGLQTPFAACDISHIGGSLVRHSACGGCVHCSVLGEHCSRWLLTSWILQMYSSELVTSCCLWLPVLQGMAFYERNLIVVYYFKIQRVGRQRIREARQNALNQLLHLYAPKMAFPFRMYFSLFSSFSHIYDPLPDNKKLQRMRYTILLTQR